MPAPEQKSVPSPLPRGGRRVDQQHHAQDRREDRQQRQRREKYQLVLEAVRQYVEFDDTQALAACPAVSARLVRDILKRLANDNALHRVASGDGATKSIRYVWHIPPQEFDADRWIHAQLYGGSPVRQSPEKERPRERLLEQGTSGLTNGDLLAILIRSGIRGESAVQAGQKVAGYFEGRLDKIPHFSLNEMKEISRCVSKVAYCQIMAGIELGRRVEAAIRDRAPQDPINSTDAAVRFCKHHFGRLARDGQQEEFHIVTLDTKLQPIQTHRITVGTLDASLVHPREVFRPAIRDAASAVLLVHNHPSGDPTPSREDHQVTRRLRSAGELLGIRVIDHIVVAGGRAVSLAEMQPDAFRSVD
ncbi:MAG: DNA repair protein RadC [Planctomycetota bacterium]|nr:MAG: DNA repair protein RadC [Planctomycetota bacterium]